MKSAINGARLSVLTVALCGSFSAFGQATGKGLKEVVVTASRYDQVVQSSPTSSTVISAAQIQSSGASDANEVIRKILGIPYRSDLNGGRNYTLDLRGYGATADQNMVVVVDGLRVSENDQATARLSSIDADSVESIEVVRGASSVQWGEGATAGVIHIVLKKGAQQGVHGSASVSLGSFGTNEVGGNVRVGGELLNLDASAHSTTSRGYRDNNAYRQDTGAIGLHGESGKFKWHARLSGENQGSRFPGPLTFAQFGADSRQTATPNDFGDFAETRLATGAEYKAGGWLFGLDVGGRVKESSGFFDGISPYSSATKGNNAQVSPRIGYSTEWGGSDLFVLLGADFQNFDYQAKDNFGQDESSKQNNEAAYVTADLLLPTGTRIVVGVRNEYVTKSARDVGSMVDYSRPNSLDAWDLGVNQELYKGWNLYGRVAQAYRVSNVDDNRYLSAALKPQTSKDLELGLKRNAGETGSGSVRVFQQDTINEIAYDPSVRSNVNLDPTRRTGFEVDGNVDLGNSVRLTASVQKLKATYSGGPNDGKEATLVSGTSAALRLHWQMDGRQSVDAGVQYLGQARFGDDGNNSCAARIPESMMLDAGYSWKEPAWEWSVAVTNLANRSDYSYAYSCNVGNLYPDNARSLKAAFKYKF